MCSPGLVASKVNLQPRREKTELRGFRPGPENGHKLEGSDLERRKVVLSE